MVQWRWSIGAGLGLGLLFAASPLLTLVLAATAALFAFAGRDLPAHERRRLLIILGLAMAVRLALIGADVVRAIPLLNDLAVGALRGDDLYYVSRAIRARDLALGLTQGRYDYFIVYDQYGRTNYLQLLTVLQTLLGPSPYGLRVLNALLFLAGSYLLFRLVRRAYGATTAAVGLIVLLFLPSLLVSSTSLLKESLYFLVSAVLVMAAVTAARHPRLAVRAAAIAAAAVALFLIEDLRRGALVLAVAGIATAFFMRLVLATPRRLVAAATLATIVVAAAWTTPAVHDRAISAIKSVATTHAGHVFTVGHAYKLLDDGFYVYPGDLPDLTDAQAARFLIRAATSFVFTPWPWQIATRSELLFLPEHLVWLLMAVLLPIGMVAGWRRDPLVTCVLVGFVLPTAAVLAVTNGNVGTLLRLRGLVSPFLIWVAVIGGMHVLESLAALQASTARHLSGASA